MGKGVVDMYSDTIIVMLVPKLDSSRPRRKLELLNRLSMALGSWRAKRGTWDGADETGDSQKEDMRWPPHLEITSICSCRHPSKLCIFVAYSFEYPRALCTITALAYQFRPIRCLQTH
jgi:hypothetical protein